MRVRSIAVLVVLAVASGGAFAADQTVRGKSLLVKNPNLADPVKRKVVGQAKESASDNFVIGNPVTGGATLAVFADGASSSSQTFTLPAAGWRAVSGGFKYKDVGLFGPIRGAQIQRSSSGRFLIKMKAIGKQGSITVVPPNPGTSACMRLDLGGGDSYHSFFGPGTPIKRNDARTFYPKNPVVDGLCPLLPTTTTTTAPTTTLTTTTTAATTTTVTTTTTTTLPPIQCCLPGSPMGAFTCAVLTASACTTAGGLNLGAGTCSPDPCPTTSTTTLATTTTTTTTTVTTTLPPTTTTTVTTTTSTTTTTLCAPHTYNFSMTSSTGGPFNNAQWPGGLTQQCASPGCCVTMLRPSGDVVIVGTLGDRWQIATVNGYGSCSFTSGCATNGGTCTSCNGVDAPTQCPLLGIPNCTSNRPSCSAGLNGTAIDAAHVQCTP